MKVVFIGAVQFSSDALLQTIDSSAQVVGVCTLSESKFNADHYDLYPLAKKYGVPCLHIQDVNSPTTLNWIQEKNPDVIFCFGWSRLLKNELLNQARLGVVGFHPAFLPRNRGRHPLIWALALGLKETASTFFFMDEGADSGDILSQEPLVIESTDDAGTLYEKVTRIALKQINEFIPLLQKGTFQRKKQDHSKANYWRKRGIKDGEIDWRMSATSICNLVRALAKPYVGAHFLLGENEVKVWSASVDTVSVSENIEPGKVMKKENDLITVKCGSDAIVIESYDGVIELKEGDYL